MRRAVLLIITLCLLTGCLGGQEIRERALIQLMGIDYSDGSFELTLQIFSPDGQNEDTAGEEQRLPLSAKGETLTEALQNASLRIGRAAFLGDCRAIVVGEQTAQGHLSDIMRFLGGNKEVYPQVSLLIAEGLAADILSPKTDEDQVVVASALENMTGSAVAKEAVAPSDLLTLSRSYYTEGAGMAVLRVRRQEEGSQVTFVPAGAVLFNRDSFAGVLSDSAHRGMLTLRGLGRGSLINVTDSRLGKTALQIKRVLITVKTAVEDGQPHFFITIKTELLLSEMSDNPAERLKPEEIERLLRLSEASIKNDADTAFNEAAGYGCDAFGLYRHLRREQPGYWKAHGQSWPDNIKLSKCHIEVKANIARVGD